MSLTAFKKGEQFIARSGDNVLHLTARQDREAFGYSGLKVEVKGTGQAMEINTNLWDIERLMPDIPTENGVYEVTFVSETVIAMLFNERWYLSTRSGHDEMMMAFGNHTLRAFRQLATLDEEE